MTARSLPRNALAKPRAVRAAGGGVRAQAWWPWFKRAVVVAFLVSVAVLMVRYARNIDWAEVWHTVTNLPHRVVAMAAGLAAVSHLLYSCFDLIGRRYVGHTLAKRTVMQVGLVSYAFNLNMGSTVGGVGFRLRLYTRLGLKPGDIVRILSLSMVTNWLGYFLVAGLLFALTPLDLPAGWKLHGDELSLVGLVFLALALGYLALCRWSPTRSWTVRGHELILPPWRMSLVQVALSAVNWMVIGATVYTLLQGKVPYLTVLSVYLVAAMAGLIVRVPGGLGVLEAVFIGMLSHRVPEGQLLGALLAYRAVYYIAPLAIGALLYLGMEVRSRQGGPAPAA